MALDEAVHALVHEFELEMIALHIQGRFNSSLRHEPQREGQCRLVDQLIKANRDEEAVPILLCPRRTSSQCAEGVRRVGRRDESCLGKFLHPPDRFGG